MRFSAFRTLVHTTYIMAGNGKNIIGKILLLDELLDSSSSSSDEEMMATLMKCEKIPKVKNMMEIVNEYSDKEVCYTKFQHILNICHFRFKTSVISFSDIFV